MNIAQMLVSRAAKQPDTPAIIETTKTGTRVLTFGQILERSARAAALLHAEGLRKGDRVVLLQPISAELYVALLGMFRLGLVATVFDPSAGREHIERCCRIARPEALLGPARAHLLRLVCPNLRRVERHIVTSGWVPGATRWSKCERFEPLEAVVQCEPSDDALLTFTSGSTGQPKAAVRSHGFLLAQYAALAESIELQPGEVDLATLPIFVLANLASGVTTVIPQCDLARPGSVEPGPVLDQIKRYGVTRTTGSPSLYARLLRETREGDGGGLETLEKLYTGGAPVFPRLLAELRAALPHGRVVVLYGSTEAEPIAHLDWDDTQPADLEAMHAGKGLLVGKPIPRIVLRIIRDQWGSPIPAMSEQGFAELVLPPGRSGEIVVSGPHVLGGYLNSADDQHNKFRVGETAWHRTGDAGYVDTTGRVWLLGRAGAVVRDKRGTLYPFAVECAVNRLPWVERSALVRHNQERVLVVELGSEAPQNPEQRVDEFVPWAQLDRVVRLPEIPVDRRHNAKVDYPSLEKELEKHVD